MFSVYQLGGASRGDTVRKDTRSPKRHCTVSAGYAEPCSHTKQGCETSVIGLENTRYLSPVIS